MEDTRKYSHERTVELLNGARELVTGKLKIIVPEWKTETKEQTTSAESNNAAINLFFIEKAEQPLYEKVSGINDVSKVFDTFIDMIEDVLDELDAIEDNNAGLDENTINTIQTYGKVFDKAEQVFENRRKKEMASLKELSTVSELKEALAQLFRSVLGDYIIKPVVTPLYETLDKNEVYPLILRELNEFLSKNGVYTEKIDVGEPIDPEKVEPSEDSVGNVAEDYSKVDTIAEVKRYPYFFADGTKVMDGYAKIYVRGN